MDRKLERFTRLLRVRKIREDAHAQSLFAARKAVDAAVAERERVSEERHRIFERVAESDREKLDVVRLRNMYSYERHLMRVVDENEHVILERREAMSLQQGHLEEAFRERRVAERLVERRDAQEKYSRRRFEQRMQDELTAIRRGVRRTPGEE